MSTQGNEINCIYISKLFYRSRGDQKAPFSIANKTNSRGGRYSFPWIVSLIFSVVYNGGF